MRNSQKYFRREAINRIIIIRVIIYSNLLFHLLNRKFIKLFIYKLI